MFIDGHPSAGLENRAHSQHEWVGNKQLKCIKSMLDPPAVGMGRRMLPGRWFWNQNSCQVTGFDSNQAHPSCFASVTLKHTQINIAFIENQ